MRYLNQICEYLCNSFVRRWQPVKFPLQHLVALLRSARYLMMPSLARWVLRKIEDHDPPMSTVRKLTLSQELPLLKLDWLRPSVGALIMIERETFDGLYAELIGLHSQILLKIHSAREALEHERKVLAYTQLPTDILPATGCSTKHHREVCYPVWNGVWWNQIARKIFHPEQSRRIEEISKIPAILRSIPWEGITGTCAELFICTLEIAGAFTVEAEIVTAAASAVREYLITLHPSEAEFCFDDEQAADDAMATVTAT